MRIDDVRVHVLEAALEGPFACSQAWYASRAALPHNPPGLHPIEPLPEFDRTEHPVRQAIVTEPIERERGVIRVPEGPGLGIEVDRDALERFRVP